MILRKYVFYLQHSVRHNLRRSFRVQRLPLTYRFPVFLCDTFPLKSHQHTPEPLDFYPFWAGDPLLEAPILRLEPLTKMMVYNKHSNDHQCQSMDPHYTMTRHSHRALNSLGDPHPDTYECTDRILAHPQTAQYTRNTVKCLFKNEAFHKMMS